MFFRKSRRESKAKLEHKLYLAKETPEPIFDISECDIKEVPQGIYSLCRVFLKERLLLQSNSLSSLSGGGNLSDLRFLKILNISDNNFVHLPDAIGSLTSLQEFYASHNSLKELPNSMCDLKNLQTLDVSHNKLKQLPEYIGNLQCMRKLDLINNHLKKLPTSICHAQRLVSLNLDPEHFEYPPQEVVRRGLEAILQYICDDVGVEYTKIEDLSDVLAHMEQSVSDFEEDDKLLQAKIWELETIKQNKIRHFLEIEKHNDILQRQELELANAQKLNREKLLQDIAKEQDEFDSRLSHIQQVKEQDKFRLIEQLHEVEQNAYAAIGKLLSIDREPLTTLIDCEKLEEERLIAAANAHNENLKKNEILEAMRNILEQEGAQFEDVYQQRVEMSKSILQREVEWENKISELMNIHESSKRDAVSKLMTDMELQKAALGTLLERSDSRSWGLLQQVSLVESQLAALTQIELDRRKLHLDEQVNDFAEKRIELSALLTDLLAQQDVRRSEILGTLKTLEDNWDKKCQDYWLKQYQALLNRIPEGIIECQKNIDPLLAEALLMNGVIHCLPHLAKIMQNDHKLEFVDEKALIDAGISSKQNRLDILDAFAFYQRQKHQHQKRKLSETQELPEATGQGPSAPPLDHLEFVGGSVTECVVCMDKEAKIWELETIKQNKIRHFLEIEKHNDILQRQELELANAQKLNREKLLQDIAKEQDEFDSRLSHIQQVKEQDKFRLIEQLHEVEQNAYAAIGKLLSIDREPLTTLIDCEKLEEERLIAAANAHNENLKKNEILEAMRNILEQEGAQFEDVYQQRVEMSKSILQREVEWENKISELMNIHESSKRDAVSKLMTDMELQKAALGTLLERSDSRSWGLLQQVSLVESQLAALTQIELDRRKLHLDEQVNDFAEKRIELSALLTDLLAQQDVRRSEILGTLKTLEDNWDKKCQDYWLKQYQALLNRIPEGIIECQKNIDPLLAEALLMNGVIHCLPHLAKIMQNDHKLEFVDEKALIDAGISSKQNRLDILDAFAFYQRQKHQHQKRKLSETQELPEATGQGPSAPPLDHLEFVGGSVTECVVCMDKECQVIFVPCGHIVCCLACSASLNLCPFCRMDIERKIRIIL